MPKLTKAQQKEKELIHKLTALPKSIFSNPKNSSESRRVAYAIYLEIYNVFTGTSMSLDKDGFILNPTEEFIQAFGQKPKVNF